MAYKYFILIIILQLCLSCDYPGKSTHGGCYVSPIGDDNDLGTIDQPWCTIGKAAGLLKAGDIVYIREGIYYETITIANSGTDGNRITLSAYEDENVVMDGSYGNAPVIYIKKNNIDINDIKIRNSKQHGISIEYSDNILIQGCTIDDSEYSAIRSLESTNIEIMDNTISNSSIANDWGSGIRSIYDDYVSISSNSVTDTAAYGIRIENSDNVIIEYNYTYDTIHSGIVFTGGSDTVRINDNEIVLACNGSYSECLSLKNVHNFSVYNNEIHTSGDTQYGGEGLSLVDESSNGLVYNNYIHDLEKVGLYLDGGIGPDNALSYIDVYNNRIDNCSEGIAIGSEQGNAVQNIDIYRNTCSRNWYHGIIVSDWVNNGPRENINIYNNTIYDNGTKEGLYDCGIAVFTTNINNVNIFNNICSDNFNFQVGINPESAAQVNVDYNLINGEQTHAWSVTGTDDVTGPPLFVNVPALDFHLTETSPAIDQGNPAVVYNDPDGTRNDIGAFYFDQSE